MVLSNNNLTATDPGNSGVVYAEGTTAITSGEKVYFEVTTTGFKAGTGTAVGVATSSPTSVGLTNDPGGSDGGAVGNTATNPYPSYANYVTVGWDGSIDLGGAMVADPHRKVATYQDGGTLDIAIDTVNNKIWYKSSLTGEWDGNSTDNPATDTGGYDISLLAGDVLYPFVDGWTTGGAAVTINGGTTSFKDTVPTGFTALDSLSSGSGGTTTGSTTSDTVTISQPTTLVVGQDTITGTETDPTQTVFLDWRTTGTPALGDSDWVQATVASDGSFTATVDIDHAGTASTLYYRIGNGAAVAAFSATPTAATTTSSGGTTSGSTTTTSPSTVTIGSGSDTLALQVSEDAWKGDAQFTVSVDGVQIGGTQTATASHSAGQTQTFDVLGNFGAGTHTVTINFVNDAYGGTSATDRNLYVTGATIDDTVVSGATLSLYSQGSKSFTFIEPGTTGSTIDSVTVNQPASLTTGVQTITGTESDPTQQIFLDWHTNGTPATSSADWVQATVNTDGTFSAAVNIDHSGVQSTLYYRIGSGSAVAAWSGTPS
jgi:hypothetical protein